jgi:hypothetical protein
MAMTMEEFRHYYIREHIQELSPEDRGKGLLPEEQLVGLTAEDMLKRIPHVEIENHLKRQNGA